MYTGTGAGGATDGRAGSDMLNVDMPNLTNEFEPADNDNFYGGNGAGTGFDNDFNGGAVESGSGNGIIAC